MNWILNPVFLYSTIIPERLDVFINKYAEHTHDKWAFEKVSFEEIKCKQFFEINNYNNGIIIM